MLEKLFAIVAKAAEVAPALIADAEGTAAAIKAAPSTVTQIEIGLDAALAGLEAIFGKPVSK